jgi:uncharacterized protein (DUF2147 family)
MKAKSTFIIFILMLGLFYSSMAQSGGEKILGIWKNADNTAHIEFYKSGSTYSAKLIWLPEPNAENGKPKIDKNNPNEKLRSRNIIGIDLVSGLSPEKSKWTGGKIYSPEKGVTANCAAEMPDKNALILSVSKGIISTTKKWSRIN